MFQNETLITALDGLRAHLLRSILTALGIIFGVAAVISMLAIGEGAREEAIEQIRVLGVRNVLIYDMASDDGEEQSRSNQSVGLTEVDAHALERIHPYVELAVPERWYTRTFRRESNEIEATVVGTVPEHASALGLGIRSGRFLSSDDGNQLRRVCALGAKLARELFAFENPVGQRVRIGNEWFLVVGVMDRTVNQGDENGAGVRDTNMDAYVPLRTALRRFERDPLSSELSRIVIRVDEEEHVREAAYGILSSMQRRHGGVDDFRVVVPEALLRQRQNTQRIFNIVMGAIASISLLVGGIGIMNIMLASVLERTREIGIRRAIGARQRDILAQFLTEAAVVGVAGGLLGILLGVILTQIVAGYAGWRVIVSLPSVLLAFFVSAGVGIIFGFYPARRAARLRPIECLRYE